MKVVLVGILVLALLVGAAWLYRDFYVQREVKKLAFKKYETLKPLMQKLESQQEVSASEILTLAKDPSLRNGVFRALNSFGRKDLFPQTLATHEKAAESFLVNWLEFPTELGIAPDEIELLEKVSLDNGDGSEYYVFKYRTADHQWMIGVSGPYGNEFILYEPPLRVFSRFKTIGSITAKNEALWVHENINPDG